MNVIGRISTSGSAWLASRAAIPLGRLTIRPASLEVAGPSQTVTLEPRCMKVLVALCDNLGGTLSRDAMIEQCWDGRIVTDAALNRSIGQVRKALALDPDLEIETIPRIGYRLRTPADRPAQSPAAVSPATESPAAETEAPRRRTWPLVTAAAALATLPAIVLIFWLHPFQSAWHGDQVRPIVTDTGVDGYPALSPRGDRLAFAKPMTDGRWRLYIKAVDGGQSRALTTSPGSEIWPGWRPDGEALAFVRLDAQTCAVVVMDIITSTQTDVARCDPHHVGRPSFAGPDRILYSDAVPGTDQYAVYSLGLDDRISKAVSTPPPGTQGDMDPIVSPDGKRVVFRRVMAWGVDDLIVADLTTAGGLANPRRLTDDGWKAHGVAWSSDSRDIIFSSNRGGDWGLWMVGLSGGEPQRISLGTSAITKVSGGPNGRLAVETYQARSDLRWLDPSQAYVKSVMADVWTVSVSRNGDVAYVSNESGSPELWVQTNGRPAQLTHLKSSYLHDTAWTAHGDGIAFVAVKDRTPQIYYLPVKAGRPVAVTDTPGDKSNPVFISNRDELIWLGRGPHGWRLVTGAARPDAIPQPQDRLGQDWLGLKGGPDAVIGYKSNDPYLYRIFVRNGAITADKTRLQLPDGAFTATRDGIIRTQGKRIILTRWDGTQNDLPGTAPDAPPQELAFDPQSGHVMAVDRSGNQSDVALMTLSRR